jgi:shikimate dehydrogenase
VIDERPPGHSAFVIGWPIAHSKSPPMINAAFRAMGIQATMFAHAIRPEDLADAIEVAREQAPLGMSVTIPHKEAVIALCDERSADVEAIGAANCLEFRDGKVIAHNTDAGGFVDSLDVQPRHAVILGAGGAARAVAYGLRASHVDVVARRPATWVASHAWSELPRLLMHADLVVDCTSAGLDPAAELDVPLQALPAGATVATLIYHQRTRLLERAAALGYSTLDGRGMLVHQGARAIAIWTGRAAPIDVMSRALDDSLVKTA